MYESEFLSNPMPWRTAILHAIRMKEPRRHWLKKSTLCLSVRRVFLNNTMFCSKISKEMNLYTAIGR